MARQLYTTPGQAAASPPLPASCPLLAAGGAAKIFWAAGSACRRAAFALCLGLAAFLPAYGGADRVQAAEGPAYSGAAAPLPVPPRTVPAPGIPPQMGTQGGAQAQQPAGTFMAPPARPADTASGSRFNPNAGQNLAPNAVQGSAQAASQPAVQANSGQNISDPAISNQGASGLGDTRPANRAEAGTAEKTKDSTSTNTSAYSWGTYFWGVGLVCFLLALLWLLLHFLRRRGLGGMGRQNLLNLEARLSMGKNQHLIVVNFAGKRLLLGVTEQNISALGEASAENSHAGTNHA